MLKRNDLTKFAARGLLWRFLSPIEPDVTESVISEHPLDRSEAGLPHELRVCTAGLVVHGRFDAIIALSNGWLLHGALPNSTFRIIEGAGHLPHVEKPDASLAVVRPFFRHAGQRR